MTEFVSSFLNKSIDSIKMLKLKKNWFKLSLPLDIKENLDKIDYLTHWGWADTVGRVCPKHFHPKSNKNFK